jgi:hypothetical protein
MPKTTGSMTETLRKFFAGNINASVDSAQAELKRVHGREVNSGLIYSTRAEVRQQRAAQTARANLAKKPAAVPPETLEMGKNSLMPAKSGPAALYMISTQDVSAVVALAERFGGMRPLGEFVGALLGNE